jgi:hypothetical protein
VKRNVREGIYSTFAKTGAKNDIWEYFLGIAVPQQK